MATIGGRMPSREAALTMIAQVERQAGAIARRYAADDNILDRFSDFRGFIDQLGEFHLFIDMVENRLGSFELEDRAAQVRKLCIIRWSALEIEIEVSSRFLDRMATGAKPWPMGSQKFLRRRLTRLDDIAGFHAAHGVEYELTPPNVGLMQNIRDRVEAQIGNSVPLADFGAAAPPSMPEAAPPDEPVAEAPMPAVPEPLPIVEPAVESPKAPEPQPAPRPAPRPPAPSQPEVMIPGMMTFSPPASKPSSSSPAEPAAASIPKPPAAAPVMPDFVIPGMMLPAAPPPPAPSAPEPAPARPVSELPPVPADYGEEYVSQKAKAVAKLAEKSAAQPAAGAKKKPPPQGMARRDFRLKVRDEADGYKYIEGNGLAVMTEVCRIANITIDDLAKTLELSRPGLVLILNGRDPVSTELLKTLRRLVLRTGGLA
jgi:hypothetical protein